MIIHQGQLKLFTRQCPLKNGEHTYFPVGWWIYRIFNFSPQFITKGPTMKTKFVSDQVLELPRTCWRGGKKSCFKTGVKMWLCKEEEPAGAAFKRWLSWRCQGQPRTGTRQRLSLRHHFLFQGLRRAARVSLGSTKGRFVNTTVKLSGDRDLSFEIHEWCFSKPIKLL